MRVPMPFHGTGVIQLVLPNVVRMMPGTPGVSTTPRAISRGTLCKIAGRKKKSRFARQSAPATPGILLPRWAKLSNPWAGGDAHPAALEPCHQNPARNTQTQSRGSSRDHKDSRKSPPSALSLNRSARYSMNAGAAAAMTRHASGHGSLLTPATPLQYPKTPAKL